MWRISSPLPSPGDRLSNFLAQNLAVTVTQALHGGFDGRLGHAQTVSDLRVSQPGWRAEIFQRFKQGSFIDLAVFRREAIQRALQKRLDPPALEDLLRSQLIHSLGKISFFSLTGIQR
jgi:hypothetical protein